MKYRKKPVVVEAFQMTKERRSSNEEWPYWLHEAWQANESEKGSLSPVDSSISLPDSKDGIFHEENRLKIMTLEGEYIISWGDYIIQGVKGEIYPCKPDIFEMTYEEVED